MLFDVFNREKERNKDSFSCINEIIPIDKQDTSIKDNEIIFINPTEEKHNEKFIDKSKNKNNSLHEKVNSENIQAQSQNQNYKFKIGKIII